MLVVIKTTCTSFLKHRCPRQAAALAFVTTFSLAPTLILIVGVCQFFFSPEQITNTVEAGLVDAVGERGADGIERLIQNAQSEDGGPWATTGGILLLLVGATGLFAQLQVSLNGIWEVEPQADRNTIVSYVAKRLLSLGMVLSIAFAIMVSLAVSTVLHAFDGQLQAWLPQAISSPAVKAVNVGFSFVLLAILFAAMFKVVPDVQLAWSDVLVGGLLTALLFTAGKYGVSAYLGSKNMQSLYGAAGSLVLVLSWVYYATMILLFGAEFTRVWARRDTLKPQPE